jgi:hypothetical protein
MVRRVDGPSPFRGLQQNPCPSGVSGSRQPLALKRPGLGTGFGERSRGFSKNSLQNDLAESPVADEAAAEGEHGFVHGGRRRYRGVHREERVDLSWRTVLCQVSSSEVHHESTGLSSPVVVSHLQSRRTGVASDLRRLLVTGGDSGSKLVMKGSSVRLRASASKRPAKGLLVLTG